MPFTELTINDRELTLEQVIIAMGPWSCLAEDWFDNPIPMEGVKSTSVTFKPEKMHESLQRQPAALFCSEDEFGCNLEVYPRPDGEIYICGMGGSDYLDNDCIKETAPNEVRANQLYINASAAGRARIFGHYFFDLRSFSLAVCVIFGSAKERYMHVLVRK